MRVSKPDGISFAFSGLLEEFALYVGMPFHFLLDGLEGVVFGMAFNKDQFSSFAHLRNTCEDVLNIAFLIACWNNHTYFDVFACSFFRWERAC